MDNNWYYVKYVDGNIKPCPSNDFDGSITGHIVIDLPAWFDENPDERIRLGWIKHIRADKDAIEYDHQSQYLVRQTRVIDEYTVEDTFCVLDKTEDMLLLEELMEGIKDLDILAFPTGVIFM